jgi:hypothetical protein
MPTQMCPFIAGGEGFSRRCFKIVNGSGHAHARQICWVTSLLMVLYPKQGKIWRYSIPEEMRYSIPLYKLWGLVAELICHLQGSTPYEIRFSHKTYRPSPTKDVRLEGSSP